LADFDAGFVGSGRKPLVIVTASDVLGSRAHHPQPMARAWNAAFDHPDVPQRSTVVVHLQRGLALLDGLQAVHMGSGSSLEMIRLEFAGDDAVLVPPAEPADLALISPYAAELGKLMTRRMEAHGGRDVARPSGKSKPRPRSLPNISLGGIADAPPSSSPRGPPMKGSSRAFRISRRSTRRGPFRTSWMISRPVIPWIGSSAVTSALARPRSPCGPAAAVALSGKQVAIAVPTTVLAEGK
jgi:transcription-repair coupling factor (superfamily II helicase)